MLDSVRGRLTAWYSLVLALVLICLAVLTYFLYGHDISKRTDSDLTQLSDAFLTTFRAELTEQTGVDAVKSAGHEAMLEHRFRGTYFALLDSTGSVLLSSFDLPSAEEARQSASKNLFTTEAFRSRVGNASNNNELQTIHAERERFRLLVRPLSVGGGNYTFAVLQSLHAQHEMMESIRNTFLLAIPIALILASMGGYFLARRNLAPVAAMALQARDMGASNLDRRLSVANERDELGQLAVSFNQLLERLEKSFEQQRRFMADASHELRTPVAILRGETEVTLSKPDRKPEEYRETLTVLGQESQRLAKIVEDLFILARADAGQYPLSMRESYLDEIASEAITRARSLASAKNITFTSSIEPDLSIRADEALLGRMVINLLDNAIKYSASGSVVQVTCRKDNGKYLLSVADNGPGIPAELQSRLFERFFRADKARSRSEGETGGAGLGLAIARWIAEAHHGQLVLVRSNDSGTIFEARLPTGSDA
jgi:two-component system, OmpR family, sensor kinase